MTALAGFFAAGAAISLISCVSLAFPGSALEPMWRVNPRAREAFASLGSWAILLLAAVSIACAVSAVGLWRGRRWGRRVAFCLLSINLAGDAVNVITGTEPRAAIGLPIAAGLLTYLATRRVRQFFGS